ncbi:Protein NSP-INTERACTING KINASE 2, partial [Cucurbita argyrosperma subsp. sororia]
MLSSASSTAIKAAPFFFLSFDEPTAASLMEIRRKSGLLSCLALVWLWASATATSTGIRLNVEVQALMGIKAGLKDPHSVLAWDENAVDPCTWNLITCSPDKLVIGIGAPSQNFSGTLSPSIGNLTNLQFLLLQNNYISGKVPNEISKIPKLHTLDLSNNLFSGEVPSSFSNLKSLQYLRLNNNTFSGTIPSSLANMNQLALLDLSYNNLSGPLPRLLAKTYNFTGNSLICAPGSKEVCYGTTPLPLSFAVTNSTYSQPPRRHKGQRIALVIGLSLACICLLTLAYGFFIWRKHRRNQQIFFETNDRHHEELSLGNIKRFQFRELRNATHNFSSKNLIGKGGFGNVYRGYLQDGTIIAVKRLKDGNAMRGETQFQTEVEMISLAVHRNLLKLYGFCMTETERLLVYPYMSNGSVATRLKAKPALDWGTRKRIALGAARGLLYLHEQSNQKGAILDWIKKLHQEKKLEMLVDKDLRSNYDPIEIEEIVRVALLCIQYLPSNRPKMSEVVRMLEGDGLAERWEASQRAEASRVRANEFSSSERYSDLTDDASLFAQAIELSGPR